jgi:hypothetical protein
MLGSVSASITTGTLWLPTGEQCAYRVVCVREDANGMAVSSVPCGYAIAVNASGADRAVSVSISSYFTHLYDRLELYRSVNVPVAVQVPDEMQLVTVLHPAATGATINYTDNVSVDGRGATLYTSPSRGGMVEANNQLARAKGLSEGAVVVRHALRAALNPVLTVFGLSLGSVLGGSVIVESVLGRDGLGTLMVAAVRGRDLPLVMGIVLVTSTVVWLGNTLAEVMQAVNDKRIRV